MLPDVACPEVAAQPPRALAPRQLLDTYCSRCHNDERLAGNLTFSNLSDHDPDTGANVEQWEKILRMTTRGEMPPEIRRSVLAWVGCIAGALEENEYRAKLKAAGFGNIELEPTRIYRAQDARETLQNEGLDFAAIAPQIDGKFMSAFVRAVKPAPSMSCCAPTCCH